MSDAPLIVEPRFRARRQVLAILGSVGAGLAMARSARAGTNPFDAPLTRLTPRPPAPDFMLASVAGPVVSLAQFRGKVVLVNFWATWCPPCRAEMPSIEHLYQALKGKGFEVLALDQGETQSAVFASLGQISPTPSFPVLLDHDSKVAHAFHVAGIPTTFLVDKTGHIAYKAIGGRDYATPAMRKIILDLVNR
ncbi:MAG: TlpA disulfide reductase family protein [Acidiphilium sp.]|nr:TlpA disulfide reductase family protein [Acidiphilium sp.]MDD4935077.1 TlpA disulfide reductase family protein [Acidiphilium sp.]